MATSYQDDFIKTALRLPRELHSRLMESSREKGRSFNSELIHVLSSYFEDLSAQVDQLQQSLEAQENDRIAIGLNDATDQAAIVKVLLLAEAMLLKSRVERLGGKQHVLKTRKGELLRNIEGPHIKGTDEERKSYFSNVVGQTPLTALLTTEEIELLAGRVVAMNRAHEELSAKSPPKKKPA